METHRILVAEVDIDGSDVDFHYGDVFVVLRDGAEEPAPTDWEATVRTHQRHHVTPDRHHLTFAIPDGTVLRGTAIVRFTDGHRHLFRGDGPLDGFVRDGPAAGA